MIMTKKDFEALAYEIHWKGKDNKERERIIQVIVPALKRSNPNFDPERFRNASLARE